MSEALLCPECAHEVTDVRDSRASGRHGGSVRRRRICRACGARFTTFELVADGDEAIRFGEDAAIKARRLLEQAIRDLNAERKAS